MSDTKIIYKPTRPDFTITQLRSVSAFRSYSETFYEVVSKHAIDKSGFKCLDACGLLGVGQAYNLESTEEIVDEGKPTMIDSKTGEVVPGPAIDWMGREITKSIEYRYHRYVVKRICDSGD